MKEQIENETDQEKAAALYNDYVRFRDKAMMDFSAKKLAINFKNKATELTNTFNRPDLQMENEEERKKKKLVMKRNSMKETK